MDPHVTKLAAVTRLFSEKPLYFNEEEEIPLPSSLLPAEET
jgi:hypothetical protein